MNVTPAISIPPSARFGDGRTPASAIRLARSHDNEGRLAPGDIADTLRLTRVANGATGMNNANCRQRAHTTHLPARTLEQHRQARRDASHNPFDHEPYCSVSRANHRLETAIGRALIDDPGMCSMARRIREITGTPLTISAFPPTDLAKVTADANFFGGAKELLGDVDNLDAHVMATLVKAERDEYSFAQPATPARGVDHLDFDVAERRKCLFNFVADEANPIYPWNSHRFDLELYAATDPVQYPERVREILADRWNDFIARHDDAAGYIRNSLGLPGHDANSGIFDILQSLEEPVRRHLLDYVLHVPWSTELSIDDECNHRRSNPLGSQFRQHKTGARSNVVRFASAQDLRVNQWVLGAIAWGKPVVSGPSGHTLRYLNHYAMCKQMHSLSGVDTRDYPSLEDARLVMLANLLTPKNHHSYHEIMLASVGVAAGEHEVLGYRSPENYADLEGTTLGQLALERAMQTHLAGT